MRRWIFLAAFLVLTALATSGCATSLLLDAAREPVVSEYRVSYVAAAWRGDNGDLAVCFYGWAAGQAAPEPPNPYTMTVPAGELESLAFPEGTAHDARNILAWPATFHDIEPGCRDQPETSSPVAVQSFSAIALDSDGQAVRQPLYELLAPADLGYPEPVIYGFEDAADNRTGIIVYQHDTPLPGGARFARLDPPYEKKYEYNAAIFLMPVAVVVDTALVLGILYLCAQGATSC